MAGRKKRKRARKERAIQTSEVEEEEEDANREDVSMSSANEESGQSARYKSQAESDIAAKSSTTTVAANERFAKADIRVFVDAEFVSTRVTQQSRWKYEWEKHR